MSNDEDIPTIGAYVPPPPGGGGGGSDDSSGDQWSDKGKAKPKPSSDADEDASDDDDLDEESLDAGRPEQPAEASSDAAGADSDDAGETDEEPDDEPGPSAFAPTRGLTDAGAAPVAEQAPDPGMTFVSTAGNPDSAPATYGEGEDEVPARIGGRFEVLQLLGKGGMGRVYRVKDEHISGRELALKVLHTRYSESPYFKELFFREIKTAQGFVSEHVNQVRDTGITDDGQLFLTMDLVDGETLRSLMRRENSLGVRHALEICRQVLLGLQSGHDQGFIHRDVKPENVMLASKVPKTDDNPFGVGARLLDFGLAGLAAELEEGGTHGTPMYMSPEQAKGERLDPRSDLFAVGTLLFELLVGSRPFHGKTVANVLTSVIETDATPLINQIEHVDKRIRKVLRKALAKKREDRFQSAAEFIKAIEKAPAFQPPTEMPGWAGAAMAVLLIAAGGAGFMWWQANEQVKAKDIELGGKQADINRLTTQATGDLRDSDVSQDELLTAQNTISEHLSTISDRDAALAAANLELETYRSKEALGESEKGLRMEALETKVETLSRQMSEKDRENNSMADEIAGLKLVQQAYNSQNDPDTRAAQGFDRLLTQLESGFLGRAHKTMAQLVDADVFAETDGLPGKELVEPLGIACLAVENFDGSSDMASKRVYYDAAQAAFDAVRAERAPFAVAAGAWLGHRESAADPDPQRLQRLDLALESLEGRLGGMQVEAVASTENLWEQIENGPADQDPTAAFQIAFQSGLEPDENLRVLADRYSKLVIRDATRNGLDTDELAQADRLLVWSELLSDPRHAAAKQWTASKDLVLLAFAREWTQGQSPRLPSERDLNVSGSAPGQPSWDWRREVHLKARMVTTNAAWPLRPTKRAVFKRTSGRGGTQWIVEEGKTSQGRPEDGSATWNVERAFHRQVGGEVSSTPFRETAIEYSLHGGRIFGWLNESADLNHEARVARFELASGDVPDSLGVSSSETDRFETVLGSTDRACLVITTADGKQRWISPELGLVREEYGEGDARQVTELVYTNVVR